MGYWKEIVDFMVRMRESSAAIIFNPSGKVAIVNQFGNNWSFPRGGINPGENEVDAAIREVYEECGIRDLTYIRKVGKYERLQMQGIKDGEEPVLKIIHVHLFRTKETKLVPHDKDITDAKWIDISEIKDYFSYEQDVEFCNTHMNIIKD